MVYGLACYAVLLCLIILNSIHKILRKGQEEIFWRKNSEKKMFVHRNQKTKKPKNRKTEKPKRSRKNIWNNIGLVIFLIGIQLLDTSDWTRSTPSLNLLSHSLSLSFFFSLSHTHSPSLSRSHRDSGTFKNSSASSFFFFLLSNRIFNFGGCSIPGNDG